MQINFAKRAIFFKGVYYGSGQVGRTSNLDILSQLYPDSQGLLSADHHSDRCFRLEMRDFKWLKAADHNFRIHWSLHCNSGACYYNTTRRLLLQGVDGIVFVADSQPSRLEEHMELLDNLRENLAELGMDLDTIPLVFQWNKRDLPNAIARERLETALNPRFHSSFAAIATQGIGVIESFTAMSDLVRDRLRRDYGI